MSGPFFPPHTHPGNDDPTDIDWVFPKKTLMLDTNIQWRSAPLIWAERGRGSQLQTKNINNTWHSLCRKLCRRRRIISLEIVLLRMFDSGGTDLKPSEIGAGLKMTGRADVAKKQGQKFGSGYLLSKRQCPPPPNS